MDCRPARATTWSRPWALRRASPSRRYPRICAELEGDLEAFRTRKLDGEFPYVFVPVRPAVAFRSARVSPLRHRPLVASLFGDLPGAVHDDDSTSGFASPCVSSVVHRRLRVEPALLALTKPTLGGRPRWWLIGRGSQYWGNTDRSKWARLLRGSFEPYTFEMPEKSTQAADRSRTSGAPSTRRWGSGGGHTLGGRYGAGAGRGRPEPASAEPSVRALRIGSAPVVLERR